MQTLKANLMIDRLDLIEHSPLQQNIEAHIRHQLAQLMLQELEQHLDIRTDKYHDCDVYTATLVISTKDDFRRYDPAMYIQKCVEIARKELEQPEPTEPTGIISELELE